MMSLIWWELVGDGFDVTGVVLDDRMCTAHLHHDFSTNDLYMFLRLLYSLTLEGGECFCEVGTMVKHIGRAWDEILGG